MLKRNSGVFWTPSFRNHPAGSTISLLHAVTLPGRLFILADFTFTYFGRYARPDMAKATGPAPKFRKVTVNFSGIMKPGEFNLRGQLIRFIRNHTVSAGDDSRAVGVDLDAAFFDEAVTLDILTASHTVGADKQQAYRLGDNPERIVTKIF